MLDHQRLLGVLLPEVGPSGWAMLKSLATTVVTPEKWLGPAQRGIAAEHVGQPRRPSTVVAKPSG